MNSTTPAPGPATQSAAPKFPQQVTGMYILAQSLKKVGVDKMFGLVGIPVTELAYICQREGIDFYSFRFEQQAGIAAQTYGYVTRKPGVLLTVSSLGFLNGLTATINATVNCYPMIQISGSSEREPIDLDQGTYEGLDQLNVAKGLVKAAYRVNRPEDIPTAVARAYRAAVSGRPGGVYLDFTTPCLGAVLDADVAEKLLQAPVDPYSPVVPTPDAITRAVELLKNAKKPAIVLGKGAAYRQIDEKIKQFIETTGIPFYPMSMAKGLMPDKHPLSALSCRSNIMEEADVVILAGARLNWLLSRGHGKWSKDTQFIQLEVDPVEIDCNRPIAAPVVGDMAYAFDAMLAALKDQKLAMDPAWVPSLQAITKEKDAKFAARLAANATAVPMNHWTALAAIKPIYEANPDVVLINEGANTLDDTRDTLDIALPRHRIDCATWAIMGMGMGSTIGAAVGTGKHVLAIEGDSAFGFSGMEISTIARFHLPVTVVIFNNGGSYNGVGVSMATDGNPAPTTLNVNDDYSKMAEAFGIKGVKVDNPKDLAAALTAALASPEPTLIDVQLAADSGKESGHIGYLNPATLIPVTV